MANCTDEQCFNDLLVQVFMIVPSQMKRVDDHIAKSTKEEETYLRVMMKGSKDRYVEAFKVINERTQFALDTHIDLRPNKLKKYLINGGTI